MPTAKITVHGVDRLLRKLQIRIAGLRKDVKGGVKVGYGAEYAIYVHENLMAYHKPPTQAKFLEQPARELKPKLKVEVARLMRGNRRTLLESLLMIGYRLLRESNKLVPVDTGYLKSSGFVRED